MSLWPVTTTLEDGYQTFAKSNPFLDPLHPAGYGLILAAIGLVTREVAVPVLLQHLAGIATALLLWAATRLVTGSAWAGLLPAAIVLLDGDEIFLEQSIMSESWAMLATAVGIYAAARSFDEPRLWSRWPVVAGAALAIAAVIRSAELLMIPVVLLALLIRVPRPFALRHAGWGAPIAAGGHGGNRFARLRARPRRSATGSESLRRQAGTCMDASRSSLTASGSRLRPRLPGCARKTPESHSGYYYMFEAPAPRLFGGFGRTTG